MTVDWQAYATGVEKQLAQIRKDLAPLENGEMHLNRKLYGGEWQDVTGEMIDHLKRTITTYETILKDVHERRL